MEPEHRWDLESSWSKAPSPPLSRAMFSRYENDISYDFIYRFQTELWMHWSIFINLIKFVFFFFFSFKCIFNLVDGTNSIFILFTLCFCHHKTLLISFIFLYQLYSNNRLIYQILYYKTLLINCHIIYYSTIPFKVSFKKIILKILNIYLFWWVGGY